MPLISVRIAGSTKKMYRQKGTGNARAGSRRSPVRRGGGHTFAKRPRDWYFRLPRKAVQLATRMALASKIMSEQVVVVERPGRLDLLGHGVMGAGDGQAVAAAGASVASSASAVSWRTTSTGQWAWCTHACDTDPSSISRNPP